MLLTGFTLRGIRVTTHGGDLARVDLPQTLPESIKCALPGRNLNDVVEHPLFADPRFRIRRVQEAAGGTRIYFDCPVLATGVLHLGRVHPAHGHQQLGRDGSLSGGEAIRDILTRAKCLTVVSMDDEQLAKAVTAGFFAGAERERIRAINLMAPPWAETIPLPD